MIKFISSLFNLDIFITSSEDAQGHFYFEPVRSFFTFGYLKTSAGESQAWGFGRHFIISRLRMSPQ